MKPNHFPASLTRLGQLTAGLLTAVFLVRGEEPKTSDAPKIGRPVRVVSFCFSPGKPLEEIARRVDEEGSKGADLIVLPETWRGQNDKSLEPLEGPTVQTLSKLAKQHHTYIVTPIDCERDNRRLNTAVVIDRDGRIVGSYDKVFPYWSEYDHKRKVQPSRGAPVLETDFGKLGLAICFDVNVPEVWERLADHGAELVLWSSAYSAGAQLGAYALLHHFYIVTATYTGDCQVYDLTGERLLDERSDGIHISRFTLDMDRGIYHTNFNEDKKAKLLKEHGDEIKQVKWLDREQWFVLQATKPGVSARTLARQYGLEELRDYITRSRRAIDEMRGWKFSEGEPRRAATR
ncbi:MAG: carbon-nitrogen hydrolase family protein [Verrucomicrobia bacterium]|nr:carbon-nitrogen hydrolase family protein [Verrucomicrobiota bacterium]